MKKLFFLLCIPFIGYGMQNETDAVKDLKQQYTYFIEDLINIRGFGIVNFRRIIQLQELSQNEFSPEFYKTLYVEKVPEIMGAATAGREVVRRLVLPRVDAIGALRISNKNSLTTNEIQDFSNFLQQDIWYLTRAEENFLLAQQLCETLRKKAGL